MESPVQIIAQADFKVLIQKVFRVFAVGSESENYTLHVDGYNNCSSAGDSLLKSGRFHDNMQFSTKDRDNDL